MKKAKGYLETISKCRLCRNRGLEGTLNLRCFQIGVGVEEVIADHEGVCISFFLLAEIKIITYDNNNIHNL